ncbi:MAG: hypothetical protein U0L33_01915 [Acutalibacteraceae bacterium]|nr:hypothetical protein [Acutalibacteraceae bacterium]
MKKVLVFLILIFVFSLPVSAQNADKDSFDIIVDEDLQQGLDDEVRGFFEENGIEPNDYNWVNKLTDKNVLSHIFKFLTGGIKQPLITGVTVMGVILAAAALTAFGGSPQFETAIYCAVLAVSAIIASDIWQSVSSAVNAVKGCSTFMLSFVPIFASVTALSGKTVTATAMSALLLTASEAVSAAVSFAILPLMGGYLALSISTGVSPLLNSCGLAESIKKISMWILSLISTLFLGVLSIQTAVNSAADSVGLRTAKFILGTSVPVAGGVLGEAVTTISASIGLLRSSVGLYGILALALILLPIIAELIIWRAVMLATSALSELFSLSKIGGILRAVDSTLSLLLGVVLLIGGLFIISLSVVVTVGKT